MGRFCAVPSLGKFLSLAAALSMMGCAPPALAGQSGASLPESLRSLPLVEFPVARPSPVMALVMSGDGNWASFIREFADTLVERGIPVVGLESRDYLHKPRTPDELAKDMEPVLRYFLQAWSAKGILVVGYSRGADFAPFLVNRLPPDLRARVRAVALMSPSRMASFEFHWTDLVKSTPRPTDISAIPEVDALSPIPVLCVYGTKDENALCPDLPEGLAEIVPLDSGHGLHGAGKLAELLLDRMRQVETGSRVG